MEKDHRIKLIAIINRQCKEIKTLKLKVIIIQLK